MPYSYFQSYLCFMHKRATKTNAHPSKKSQYQIGFNIFVRPKETSRIDSNSFPYSLWLSKESPIICHDTKKNMLITILSVKIKSYITLSSWMKSLKYEPFINAQEKWCITHKFYTTPILFINGRKFPSYYNIKDIDFLYS